MFLAKLQTRSDRGCVLLCLNCASVPAFNGAYRMAFGYPDLSMTELSLLVIEGIVWVFFRHLPDYMCYLLEDMGRQVAA